MKFRLLAASILASVAAIVHPADAGSIFSISYTDLPIGSTTTDLTAAGTLDWVKWGNGDAFGTVPFATSEKAGASLIDPTLTPLGSAPSGASVVLVPFAPDPTLPILDFTWTDGTEPMAGGGPVGTVVSQTITPAQTSYPNGLGLSFQVQADADPRQLDVYVQGFNTRMRLSAELSGGGGSSLLAATALIDQLPAYNNNFFSAGKFSVIFSGAGETLTIRLTADNQVGIPTDAPQSLFRNAGVFAATVATADLPAVPEPSSLLLMLAGGVPPAGLWLLRRRAARPRKLPGD
ncbi:PEP-CTERM sorting domain-containing protein [Tautonia sociabilis]|uniref:PEP-CTERM sorting domain-containing protein n=1 Tax=Tautonia sociabilis TaxID=2080755 RepID=A0A432MCF3_9BACT|nr:PEP-CTERM sorting domain-containing protein [Tautonia sociabilis]RUL81810.1 PEP-CTERM sorting domain-containing protein [Tautonia sociabilis]